MAEQRRAVLSLDLDRTSKGLRGSREQPFQLRAALVERQLQEILPVELPRDRPRTQKRPRSGEGASMRIAQAFLARLLLQE
jgi:hypothetical protein